MKKSPVFYTVGLAVFAMFLCVAVNFSWAAAESPFMKPAEASDLIQKNKGNLRFVILDVRTPEEFKTGHIERAVNVDYNSNAFRTEVGKLDRKKTYLVYCRTGRRSTEAVKIMRDLGFKNLLRFEGDMVAWQAAKLPVVQ